MIYGYARVSSQGQDFNGQVAALKKFGATKIYSEKFTGTTANRPALKRLERIITSGDVLVVTKLDRLARSVREGIKIIDKLTKKGITVHVLNLGLLDNSPSGHLLRNIMLTLAEFERDMIVDRLAEGRARAKAINPHYREASEISGYSRSTLYRIKRQIEGNSK